MKTIGLIIKEHEAELRAIDEKIMKTGDLIQLFARKLKLTRRHFDSLGQLSDAQDAEDRKKQKKSGNKGDTERISTHPELKPIQRDEK